MYQCIQEYNLCLLVRQADKIKTKKIGGGEGMFLHVSSLLSSKNRDTAILHGRYVCLI